MLLFLHSVLLTCIVIIVSAEVKVDSHGVGLRDHSLDGRVSNQHLLFQADVSTKLACASFCMRDDCSVAFSTSPKGPPTKKMTCRCHDSKAVRETSKSVVPGSRTYFLKERPSGSSWLERPCTMNSDCPTTVANVECFANTSHTRHCLCQPGYFYSHCRDGCVADCPTQDLQPTFLKYANRTITGANTEVVNSCWTIEEARQHCLNIAECRAFDFKPSSSKFYSKDVTLLTPGVVTGDCGNCAVDLYQRTCL